MGCDIHPRAEVRINGVWRLSPLEIPSDRNYITFAALANVRNGVGFAGSPTHQRIPFIAEPRGLPDDLSAGSIDMLTADDFTFGDHSFSWVTLLEMRLYPAPDINRTGLCLPKDINGTGRPKEWCSDVYGTGADKYVRHNWTEPFKDAAPLFTDIMSRLSWMEADSTDASPLVTDIDIRLVFGFDS